MGKIKVIIFDLDDTLYNEESYFLSGLQEAAIILSSFSGENKKLVQKNLIEFYKVHGRSQVFDNYLKQKKLFTKDLRDKLVKGYRAHYPSIILEKKVLKILNLLAKSYKMAMISDGIRIVQKQKIRALGLDKIFDLIIIPGMNKAKPNVWPYRQVISHFKVDGGQAVYIGDNPVKDFVGAKKLGIKTVRVVQGPHKNILLTSEFEADFKTSNLYEAIKLVTNL